MKKMLYFIMIFLSFVMTIIFIQYCNMLSNNSIQNEQIVQSNTEKNVKKIDTYKVYVVDKKYNYELYEPEKQCYLGAYVLSNKFVNFSMDEFEQLTGKKHAVYLRNMHLGDEICEDWILDCISKFKTPCFIIEPPNKYYPYQKQLLETTVKSFSNYYVPTFVQFYPNPSKLETNYEEYIEFFKEAYNMFKKYAPNVSLIWSINYNNIYESHLYYPGDEYVNWIGLNIILPAYKLQNFNGLDLFYEIYEDKKPLMISQLAISHFSDKNHKYYIEQSKQIFDQIYKNIQDKYPRIKCINYLDAEKFSITVQSDLLNYYKNLIQNYYFSSEVKDSMDEKIKEEKFNFNCKALNYNNKLYLEKNILNKLHLEKEVTQIDDKIKFNNITFCSLKYIDKISNYSIIIKKDKIYFTESK